MKVNVVSREKSGIPASNTSKSQCLLNAIKKLKPGGKVIRVSFEDDKELNTLRNIVYKHNREVGTSIKSSQDPEDRYLYFFKN